MNCILYHTGSRCYFIPQSSLDVGKWSDSHDKTLVIHSGITEVTGSCSLAKKLTYSGSFIIYAQHTMYHDCDCNCTVTCRLGNRKSILALPYLTFVVDNFRLSCAEAIFRHWPIAHQKGRQNYKKILLHESPVSPSGDFCQATENHPRLDILRIAAVQHPSWWLIDYLSRSPF